MGISRYIFTSIYNCDKHPEVPLMNIKTCTEEFLASSGVPYTVLRMCGFMQAVIGNYAVPILEDKGVWGTNDTSRTAYLDATVSRRGALCSLPAGKHPSARVVCSARPSCGSLVRSARSSTWTVAPPTLVDNCLDMIDATVLRATYLKIPKHAQRDQSLPTVFFAQTGRRPHDAGCAAQR